MEILNSWHVFVSKNPTGGGVLLVIAAAGRESFCPRTCGIRKCPLCASWNIAVVYSIKWIAAVVVVVCGGNIVVCWACFAGAGIC